MKKNNYKVGDKVLLTNERPWWWMPDENINSYLGKVVTISRIVDDNFEIKEDNNTFKYLFRFEDIVRKANDKHFKSYPNNYTGTLNIENGYVIEEKGILDETEKRYLENVTRPFKNRIIYLVKDSIDNKTYYIRIYLDNNDYMAFPNFSKNSDMYKNMEYCKSYTLEELGLFKI